MKNSLETIENISVDLERLAQVIQEAGKPMSLDELIPEVSYVKKLRDHFKNQPALVKAIQDSGNTQYGHFRVLTLVLPDGTEQYKILVGEYVSVILQDVIQLDLIAPILSEKKTITRKMAISPQEKEVIRNAIQEALRNDKRFVCVTNKHGKYYCLGDLLPPVGKAILAKVADRLGPGLVDGEPISETTEDLVKIAWETDDDDSDMHELRDFALSLALRANGKFKALGTRWTLTEAWQKFTERSRLRSPRMPTDIAIPEEVAPASQSEINREIQRIEAGYEKEAEIACESKPQCADFTLSAYHYYAGWFPLTKPVRCLLQDQSDMQIRFYPQWEEIDRSFRAWIDLDEGKIWLSPHRMYDAFRRARIYPGARLRLSYRMSGVYNLTTLPATKQEPIRVGRIWLENGEIQYSDDLESPQYKIDTDVFIADVRFEDLDALFRQAEEAGNSIFGLMYERAVEWWRANDCQELQVTVDEMYESIHFDEQGRMTHKATVAWELWRRLAFESVGGGNYRFRPEYGAAYAKRGSWGVIPKPSNSDINKEKTSNGSRSAPPTNTKTPLPPGDANKRPSAPLESKPNAEPEADATTSEVEQEIQRESPGERLIEEESLYKHVTHTARVLSAYTGVEVTIGDTNPEDTPSVEIHEPAKMFAMTGSEDGKIIHKAHSVASPLYPGIQYPFLEHEGELAGRVVGLASVWAAKASLHQGTISECVFNDKDGNLQEALKLLKTYQFYELMLSSRQQLEAWAKLYNLKTSDTDNDLRVNIAKAIRKETQPTLGTETGPRLQAHDFRNEVKGTTWRRKENVAGALAQRLSNMTSYTFKSYPIYRFTQVHIARPESYDKHASAKLMIKLFETGAWYGLYIEKRNRYMDKTWDWQRFVTALSVDTELHEKLETLMRRLGLYWRIFYGGGGDLLAYAYAVQQGLRWHLKDDKQGENISWQDFSERFKNFDTTRWYNVYLGTYMPKEQALAAGPRIVDIVTRAYRGLLPLYLASIQSD